MLYTNSENLDINSKIFIQFVRGSQLVNKNINGLLLFYAKYTYYLQFTPPWTFFIRLVNFYNPAESKRLCRQLNKYNEIDDDSDNKNWKKKSSCCLTAGQIARLEGCW